MISSFNAILQGVIFEGKEIEFSLVHIPFEAPGQPSGSIAHSLERGLVKSGL